MFNDFKCSVCLNEIQAPEEYSGELVECPLCSSVQIVPDLPIPAGTEYNGYKITEIYSSSHLWTSYKASGVSELQGQNVLIRIPSSFFIKNTTDFKSFENIVIKTGSLNIPNFSVLLARSLNPGKIFFVYDFDNIARTLSSFCGEKPFLTPENSLRVVRRIAIALNKAWSKEGLLHLNLKPSNIRIAQNWEVQLYEFGVSGYFLQKSDLLKKGFNIWDHRYMSPEFISQGKAQDPRADIYSLGGIYYMLLTGKHPFQDLGLEETLQSAIPDPRDFNPLIQDKYVNIYRKMFTQSPEERIQTWSQAIETFDSVIALSSGSFKKDSVVPQSSDRINLSSFNTGKFEPVGQTVGVSAHSSNIRDRKKFKATPQKKDSPGTKTMAQLSKQDFEGLDKQWNRENKMKPGALMAIVIASAILVLVIGVIIIYFAIGGNDEETAVIPSQDVQTENVLEPQQDQTVKTVDSSVVKPAEAAKTDMSKKTKLVSSNPLEQKYFEACEYYKNNPADFNGSIKKIKSLEDDAVASKNIKFLDKIMLKVTEIESDMAKQIDPIIAQLRKDIEPLIAAEQLDKAIETVSGYKGPFAVESFEKRQMLANEIKKTNDEKPIKELKAEVNKLTADADFDKAVALIENYAGPLVEQTRPQRMELLKETLKGKENFLSSVTPLLKKKSESFALNSKNIVTEELEKLYLDKTASPAVSNFIKNLADCLASYNNFDTTLKNYFQENLGKEITITLKSKEPETVLIKKVEEDKVSYLPVKNAAQAPKLLTFSQLSIQNKFAIADTLLPKNNIFLKGFMAWNDKSFDEAKVEFQKLPSGLGGIFTTPITEEEAEYNFSALLAKYDLNFNKQKTEQLLFDLNQKKVIPLHAKNLLAGVSEFRDKYKDTEFMKKYGNIYDAIQKFCKRSGAEVVEDKDSKSIVISPEMQEKDFSLSKLIEKAPSGSVIVFKEGTYNAGDAADIKISKPGITLKGEGNVVIERKLFIESKDFKMMNLKLKEAFRISSDGKNATIKNCYFEEKLTEMIEVENVTLENCLFRGLRVEKMKNLSINHCTIISPSEGVEKITALWIKGDSVTIENSIIYGNKYGIIFLDEANAKNRKISNSVVYGEDGICALEEKEKIDKKDIVESDKKGKIPKFFKDKKNIYSSPQFVDDNKGNWRLVKNVSGYKKADDGKDCGIVFED